MPDTIRIQGRPVPGGQRQAPSLGVAARPIDYGMHGAAPDADLVGLIRGLEAFNPALQRYAAQQDQFAREDGSQAGRIAGSKADLTDKAPGDIVPPDLPPETSPAYASSFTQAFKVATAHRLGIQAKAEALSAFEQLRNTEGFVPETWLAQRRQEVLAGINDPDMADVMSRHFGEFEQGLMGEIHRDRIRKRDEARLTTMQQLAADAFTGDLSGPELRRMYDDFFLKTAESLQFDKKQAAALFVARLADLSMEGGGRPEVFDILDAKDKSGVAITSNPELATQVRQLRARAKQHADKWMLDKLEPAHAQTLMEFESDIDTRPEAVTMDRILSHMGQFGAVGTPEKAASLWNRAQAAVQKKAADASLLAAADGGYLWLHKPEDQKKVLSAKFGPVVQQLVAAAQGNDPAAVAQLAQQLMYGQSRTMSSEGVEQLERFLQTSVTNLPAAEGPTPSFLAAAGLYRAFSANPKFRSVYFKGDTADLMDAFNRSLEAHGSAKQAYADAYRAISPEEKAAAEARLKDPAFSKDAMAKAVRNVQGSSWWPRWLGGNGRPKNDSVVSADAAMEAKRYLARVPNASDDQVQNYIAEWAAKNYALDETSGMAVKVPPGMGGQLAQRAISSYSKAALASLRSAGIATTDTTLEFLPTGTEGQYRLVMLTPSGARETVDGMINLSQLIERERFSKLLTADERAQLGAYKAALQSGAELPLLSVETLGKARLTGYVSDAEFRELDRRQTKQFLDRIRAMPSMSFGDPGMDSVGDFSSKPVKVDHKLTADIATQLAFGQSAQAASKHQSLAASLITLGEAVALRPYRDPNPAAGLNIGMGYNLKANAATVDSDLKRAGVPEDKIEGVKAGEVELLPDQATRLLRVTMERHEKSAKAQAERTKAGLWEAMTPQQRAVMIDISWQVGDTEKFSKAWAALAAGDQEAFASSIAVQYRNANGELVKDTRRNRLRANLLAGDETWLTTLQRAAGTPSTKLQALMASTK